jgi:hypothetical protein
MKESKFGTYLLTKFRNISPKLYSYYLSYRIPNSIWEFHDHWYKVIEQSKIELQECDNEIYSISEDLRIKSLNDFVNKYGEDNIKILIQSETPDKGIGADSIFSNWVSALNYMGVNAKIVYNDQNVTAEILRFEPTLFFTSDHYTYLDRIDWCQIKKYRDRNNMLIALTASAAHDGNSVNKTRIANAIERNVDFFISFRTEEYINTYLWEWKSAGFNVLSIPFGANPLVHYCLNNNFKPLDFIFFGSTNPIKSKNYIDYLLPILLKYKGFVNGPGWKSNMLNVKRDFHSVYYSFAKIGLNLHIPISLEINSEINERSFILASSGVFQIMDNPKALNNFFTNEAIVVCENPKEFYNSFKYFLANPRARIPFQINSLKQVYEKNTIFHRMTTLLDFLKNHKNNEID